MVDDGTGNARFQIWADRETTYITASNASIADNKWHHIAGIYDGDTGYIKIFVDGNEVASKAITLSSFVITNGLISAS